MRILFAVAEAYPLVKTGGLADVASGLPAALAALGNDVRIILPAYPEALAKADAKGASAPLGDPLGAGETGLLPCRMPDSGVPALLVDCPALFDRPGSLYQDAKGHVWPDNHLRFALLSKAAAMVASGGAVDGWRPDVLHANDWHTGLIPLYLKRWDGARTPSVFTIHNLHYQGLFERAVLQSIGLSSDLFSIDGVEYHGKVSFMKAGLQFSDRITTVSPAYAREIQGEEMGEGLQGLIRAKSHLLRGILNGVDYGLWDSSDDKALAGGYSAARLGGKAECKRALQREMGLNEAGDTPLLGVVGRFTRQKGMDLLLKALDGIFGLGAQVTVLGSGEAKLEHAMTKAANASQGRMAVKIGYDEELAHRIIAGSDMVVMPSRFEPCGLTQLYALRYGALPIVRRTGGLADSVIDISQGKEGTGFVFDGATAGELLGAVKRGVDLYRRPKDWRVVQKTAMTQDFSWKKVANEYLSLYNELLP
ncbi:MAG: starch synthase [Rhodospirillales bacterium RIFCSPLOWO2_12_FULL_58_28]|nr:MAG: starch synthase [Rhodospirillales bacterium RIFCSPLOWO2_02_FULL_58_16]OHC77023.1 MAG: starch synthase [Rhodospirillales bacterium RIFCSPLOWO2_12_FULL_58_28]